MRAIISIILILLAGGLFFTFTDAHYKAAKELRSEEAQYDEAIARSRELVALRDTLLSQYNGFPADQLDRLNTLLPDSIDNVRLIIDINTIARAYDMSLSSISVGATDADSSASGLGPNTNAVGTVELAFSVRAPYERFLAFLADLERSLRLVDIVSVSFGTLDPSGVGTFGVTLQTYWLK